MHVFWGDERYVLHIDPKSYRVAKEMLLPLRTLFAGEQPCFDLVLLGLGPEGHTTSLFPGSPVLAESTRWVRAVSAPADPPTRSTLTWPALTGASNIYVLVTGANKAQALRHVVGDSPDESLYPAGSLP